MRIRWLASAKADIDLLYRYVAADSPPAAAHVVRKIRAAGGALAAMPHRGRPGRWHGTRELVVPGTPYLLPYRVRGRVIEILRVLHGARDWPEEPPADG